MGNGEAARPVIGLLINQMEGRYQSLLRRGLADLARERGCVLRTFVGRSLGSPYGNEDLFNAIYGLARGRAGIDAPDGLVVAAGSIGSFVSPGAMTSFLEGFGPIPIVTIGMEVPGFESVTTDNRAGMSALVDHLVERHSFRRFAFLSGPAHSPDALERLSAWNGSLDKYGIPANCRLTYEGDYSYGSGHALAARLDPAEPLPFDALSCANDDMALGFLRTMEMRGLRCPRDFAVTGFDDIPEAGFLTPLLTTVHQPLYEQARVAGRRLLAMLGHDGGATGIPDEGAKCVPIIRESCGCADLPSGFESPAASSFAGPVKTVIASLVSRQSKLPEPCHAQAVEALWSLCDAASLDLRKFVDRPLFLQTLSGWFDSTVEWEDFADRWHVLLGLLRKALTRDLADTRSRLYAEDLFVGAYSLLSRKGGEHHARRLSSLRNALHLFRGLSTRLGSARDRGELVSELSRIAPALALTRVSLSLHREGPKPFGDASFADGVFPDGDFYRDTLVYPCVEGSAGDGPVWMPLLDRERSHGYVELGGTGVDPLVYESLRDLVSHTLDSLIAQDERVAVERALRESEERYREIAAAVPIMVLETDVMFGIQYANPTAREGLSLPEGDALVSLKRYFENEDRELASDIARRIPTIRELDYPGIRLMSPQRRRYIPVVRVSGKFDLKGNLVSLRWNALDPLPFLKDGVLPDRNFFAGHKITEREQEIVELQLQGYRIRDIAGRLGIAESTVKGHLTQVYNKLGISGKGELLRVLKDERGGKLGFSAYVFSLVNRLLSIEEE